MDELTPRRRLSPWVVGLVAVVINLPVVTHLMTQRDLARSGVDVEATLVDSSSAGEGDSADYGVAFRFDEAIDPDQVLWTSGVDRVAFQRANDTGTVAVRVLPDEPSSFEVAGAVTTRIGWYLTAFADVLLLAAVLWLWRHRRARTGAAPTASRRPTRPDPRPDPPDPPDPSSERAPERAPAPRAARRPRAEPAATSPMLRLEALEDVQRHVPALGSVGLEDLGSATYLVTGAVSGVAGDAVVVDTGEHHVLVSLGTHSNLVAPLQPGQVLARVPHGSSARLPE